MADKPDDALEEVSQTTELSPELIQFKTLLESTFIDVELAFVMTDQIPSVVVPKESLHDLCVFLKTNSVYDSKMLSCMAGVDYVDYCQILYILYSVFCFSKIVVHVITSY